MSRAKHQLEPRQFDALAGILAWVIPGGGHIFVLGDRKRGFAIMAGILFLIICGLLVGGVQVVDQKDQKLWFVAQVCNGPIAFVINGINQNYVKSLPADELDPITSFGRVQELGILFVALAGLMNLAVVIDAMHHRPPASKRVTDRPAPADRPERPAQPAEADDNDDAGGGDSEPTTVADEVAGDDDSVDDRLEDRTDDDEEDTRS